MSQHRKTIDIIMLILSMKKKSESVTFGRRKKLSYIFMCSSHCFNNKMYTILVNKRNNKISQIHMYVDPTYMRDSVTDG